MEPNRNVETPLVRKVEIQKIDEVKFATLSSFFHLEKEKRGFQVH